MILTLAQLKAKFANRDKPDQSDFTDMIDTLAHLAGLAGPITPPVAPAQITPSSTPGQVLTTVALAGGADQTQWADLPDTSGFLTGFLMPSAVLYDVGYPAPPAAAQWLLCNGQMVSKSTYAALYAKLGTAYGAESASSFKLPDFTGCYIVGKGPGMIMGQTQGSTQQKVFISTANLPPHAHPFPVEIGQQGLHFQPDRGMAPSIWTDNGTHVLGSMNVSQSWTLTLDRMPVTLNNQLKHSPSNQLVTVVPWGNDLQPLTISVAPTSLPAYIYIKT